ncbi:MAG: hypothetical protein BTN85_1225 [Candidatus Methanohalarchaeum thermophilum]|uniref:Uncharacterized protein n=1 Tax=Methanohalarchaeum thermophilum TaxID=1903181 RepID=A0A1Q6DWK1_METT1|nr:MAG: hypothetical protein BTN85_1225 [Candidatus Methanohalarchaeum thermophilum]
MDIIKKLTKKRKGIPAALALLLIIGIVTSGAAAYTITTYATQTQDVTYKQAVVFDDGSIEKKHELSLVGGETAISSLIIKNKNTEKPAPFALSTSYSDGSGLDTTYNVGKEMTVNFQETGGDEDPKFKSWTLSTELSGQSILYKMDFPRPFDESIVADNVDLEIDLESDGVADFHVKYKPSKAGDTGFNSDGWTVKLYNEDGTGITENKEPSEVTEVKYVSANDGLVKIKVAGLNQQFEIRGAMGNDDDGQNDFFTYPSDDMEYFGNCDADPLQPITEGTLQPGESMTIVKKTTSKVNLGPDDYTIKTQINQN